MAYIAVYTDKGEQVWSAVVIGLALRRAECPGNQIGSAIIAGLRRAVEDAEAIEQGRDPERPSEKAMRLSEKD